MNNKLPENVRLLKLGQRVSLTLGLISATAFFLSLISVKEVGLLPQITFKEFSWGLIAIGIGFILTGIGRIIQPTKFALSAPPMEKLGILVLTVGVVFTLHGALYLSIYWFMGTVFRLNWIDNTILSTRWSIGLMSPIMFGFSLYTRYKLKVRPNIK